MPASAPLPVLVLHQLVIATGVEEVQFEHARVYALLPVVHCALGWLEPVTTLLLIGQCLKAGRPDLQMALAFVTAAQNKAPCNKLNNLNQA